MLNNNELPLTLTEVGKEWVIEEGPLKASIVSHLALLRKAQKATGEVYASMVAMVSTVIEEAYSFGPDTLKATARKVYPCAKLDPSGANELSKVLRVFRSIASDATTNNERREAWGRVSSMTLREIREAAKGISAEPKREGSRKGPAEDAADARGVGSGPVITSDRNASDGAPAAALGSDVASDSETARVARKLARAIRAGLLDASLNGSSDGSPLAAAFEMILTEAASRSRALKGRESAVAA